MRSSIRLRAAVAASLVFMPLGARAQASAVAFDQKTGALGWAYGLPAKDRAEGNAMARCISANGAECAVVLSCEQGGYGAIYRRFVDVPTKASMENANSGRNGAVRTKRRPQFGMSCGSATQIAANDEARYRCELQVAIALGGIPAGEARYEWSFVLERLRRVCPGLGNCRCGDRIAAWYDRVTTG
ncbi:MAG: DUF4189 domain-containing protein [Gemmatimonadota bacterium]